MAKAKKSIYIESELEWLQSKALEIKKFADANPYHQLEDRLVTLNNGDSTSEKVAATVEAQQKSIRESLKDYALIIESINKLKEIEEQKQSAIRGGEDLSPAENGDLDF